MNDMFATFCATIVTCSHKAMVEVRFPAESNENAIVVAFGAATATSNHGLDAAVELLVIPLCLRFKFTAEKVAPPVVGVTVITA